MAEYLNGYSLSGLLSGQCLAGKISGKIFILKKMLNLKLFAAVLSFPRFAM